MDNIITAYAIKNNCYKTAAPIKPVGIVVHSTGANNPYLKRYVDAPDEVGNNLYGNHWNNPMPGGRDVCVHSFIGYDRDNQIRVANILPYTYAAWGVGRGSKGSYNYAPTGHIQFEICEDGLDNADYFNKVFAVAAEYCAYLCKEFNLSPDSIVGHCEAAALGYGDNHADPEHWMKRFGRNMDDFRNDVKRIIKERTMNKIGMTVNANGRPLDNTPDAYAKPAVEKAVGRGILMGDEHGDLMLHSNITRQDVLVVLGRLGLI